MWFGIASTEAKLHGEERFGCGGKRRLVASAGQAHVLPSRISLMMRRECKPDHASCQHTMTSSGGS